MACPDHPKSCRASLPRTLPPKKEDCAGEKQIVKIFAKFFEVFASFFDVRKFFELFGCVRTDLDPFGPAGTRSDAFGCIWKRVDIFEQNRFF